MPRLKLAPDNPLESQRQAGIIDYLALEPRVKFSIRINSGGVKASNRFIWFYRLFIGKSKERHDGVADIIGMLRNGRFFAIDAKRPGEKPTPEQAEFLALVSDAGGIAGVCCNWMEARSLINEEERT